MNFRLLMITVLVSVVLSTSACSAMQGARHEYLMRGQVTEVTGSDAVLCVGSQDGAKSGQEFTAYKLVSSNVGGPRNPTRWEKVKVGTVKIVKVVDEHFATAQITSGEIQVNNIVELNP